MVNRETYLTEEGLARLNEELEHLKSVRRPEVAGRIHTASEDVGTADDAEYEEAKSEQSFVEGRIQDLENILANAVAAPKRKRGSKVVEFGASVTVHTADGKKRRYQLVGSAETAPLEGKISDESPVGKALLGKTIGDEVEVETPAGVMKLTIDAIR